MGWDGNGNFTREHDWESDRDAGIDILASRHDEEDDNFATGIAACLTKNGETKPTATFSPNATRSYDLGSTALRWRSGYFGTSLNFQSATAAGAHTISFTDGTEARTVTFPDLTGTVMLLENAQTVSGAKTFSGITTNSAQVRWAKGTALDDDDVDGSNILTVGTDGNTFDFSGTQQVDEIATVGVGTTIRLIHTSARQLTHDATDLILPGGANITTASGDISEWFEYATGDWRCTSYQRASGNPVSYVVGTFTPVLTFSTPGDLSVTYDVQLGNYVKIGRLVTINITIITSAFTHSTANGDAHITGLPFASSNTAGYRVIGALRWSGITKANYTDFNARLVENVSLLDISASGSGQTVTTVQRTDMPSGGSVVLQTTLSYLTD